MYKICFCYKSVSQKGSWYLPSPSLPPLSVPSLPLELSLMFSLMDRIQDGVEPMLRDLESYILQSGLDDMKANADVITTVSMGQLGLR